jgi:hypothetical protein
MRLCTVVAVLLLFQVFVHATPAARAVSSAATSADLPGTEGAIRLVHQRETRTRIRCAPVVRSPGHARRAPGCQALREVFSTSVVFFTVTGSSNRALTARPPAS